MIERVKGYLRKSNLFVQFFRSFTMSIKRKIYGLKDVSPSFYTPGWSKLPADLIAGDYSYIAKGCSLCPKVKIGRYTMLAPGVTITGADHNFDRPGIPIIFSGRPALPNTVIGSDVWIGNGALIMAGVSVGNGSIIAARSVVTSDVPSFAIYGGVPAKKLRDRFSTAEEKFIHNSMLETATYQGDFCKPLGES